MQIVGGKVEEFVSTNYSNAAYLKKFSDLIFCKKIYGQYLCLRIFKNKSLIGGCFNADSIDPGWESNPGHLFKYHTTRITRFL